MTHEEPEADEFLRTWFCKLPWLAIETVLSHVELRFMYPSLLQVPKLRHYLIWHFSSRTIMLSPGQRLNKFLSKWSPQYSDFSLDDSDGIESFFLEYPDILPNKFIVATEDEFAASYEILQKFHHHIAKAPKLEIWLVKTTMGSSDFDAIFQYSNLVEITFNGIDLETHCHTLSRKFVFQTNLRKLQFLGCKFPPSASVHLPPDLELLQFSVRDTPPAAGVMSPSSELVSRAFPGNTNAHTAAFHHLAYPETLKDLWIRNYAGVSVDFSLLPPALKSFTLSGKYWDVNGGPILPWPRTLTSIKVSFASERGPRETDLLPAKWPSRLKELHLNGPWLHSLDVLSTLPPTIEDLQIENAGIDTLDVFDNGEYCSYQKLLPALKSLKFRECRSIDWELFNGEDEEYFPPRIVFPPGLKYLEILNCGLENLSYLEFPVSLKVLDLGANKISNINSYESYEGEDELIRWDELINLEELNLHRNEIESIAHWYPPRSLAKLFLSNNRIQRLTPWETPLFNVRFRDSTRNLEYLNLSENRLLQIELNLHIPSNLIILDLSENLLRDFKFIDSIASHEKLRRLDLRKNSIMAISLPSPRNLYASSLKEIDLYLTHGTDKHPFWQEDDGLGDDISPEYENTFYGVFEQLGLKNIKRNGNLATAHFFY